MQIYLVGGAVRNQLLGLPIHEKDWVVVGGDEEALLALGYQRVGKSFPVFLHPETREEYALARRELKTGPGYKGFECDAGHDVTLEEDLKRRDLTINAMAMDEVGQLIDHYRGQEDIEKKMLRHVSPAFPEDPLRVLRVARFAAALPDFEVHPATMDLMQEMVASGELDHLIAERVWQEITKALLSVAPHRFFEVLKACGAFEVLFPELDTNGDLKKALQCVAYMPDIDQEYKLAVRWAVCSYKLSEDQAKVLSLRFKAPKNCLQLAVLVARYAKKVATLADADAETIVAVLEGLDAWRRGRRLQCFFVACVCIHGAEHPGVLRLRSAYAAAQRITPEDLLTNGLSGEALGQALHAARIAAVKGEG